MPEFPIEGDACRMMLAAARECPCQGTLKRVVVRERLRRHPAISVNTPQNQVHCDQCSALYYSPLQHQREGDDA